MRQIIRNRRIQISLLILYLIPILLLIGFIAKFRVNVPSWDEWPVSTIFEKVATGELSFSDLIEPYNQHRYLFLRLILIPLAFLTNWNKDYELACSVILAILTGIIILQISRQKLDPVKGIIPFHLANISTAFIIFSLVQYQNWLWGLQIGVFLVNFCLVLSVWIMTAKYQYQPEKSLFLAAIPCIIASFTMAQGLTTWLAVLPSIYFQHQRKQRKMRSLLYWFGLFLMTCWFYFLNYPESESKTSKFATVLSHPLYFLKFFFTVLGAPLAHYSSVASLAIGILLILVFLGLILWGIKLYQFKFFQKIAPWLSFATFAILFSAIVTLGRANIGIEFGRGVDFALGSRYTTNSLFIIIAVIQIYYSLFPLESFPQKINLIPKLLGFNILWIVLLGVNSIDSINKGKIYHQRLEAEKFCLNLIQVLDERHHCWHWWEIMTFTDEMRNYAKFLNSINFINSPDIKFIDSDTAIHGKIITSDLNQQIFVQNPNDVLSISGDLRLSKDLLSDKQSYLVALSYGNRKTIIATSHPYSLNKYQASHQKLAWNIFLYAETIPLGETTLKAWLYQPQKQQFIRLPGEVSVKRLPENFDKNATFNAKPTETYGFLNTSTIPPVATANQRVIVSGWARLPAQTQQPSHVFLSYDDEKYFAASTEVNLDSPDVAQALGSNRYRQARWLTSLPTWTLPPGETTIKAWVYNPKQKQFVKLENDVTVKVFPEETAFVSQSQEIYGYIDSSKLSENSLTLSRREPLPLEGWARLPDALEQPQQVMFSYGNEQSFFAVAYVNLSSPDVAETFNSPQYNQVRWKTVLPLNFLPLGETVIKAWVYHPEKQQFVQLENEVTVTIVD
ncbi:hypothetical protein [Limnoraphis robusta]|uniref:Uncharacterized protein n=1 Tax=Limnoraphis robusta CCNP1315 TaxID=3110306 RepID=A0ABU5U214_9CYAN|nr:hypothetical protein [Limnoraphis robusta]MEA5521237.1 hypothetical protein [Limnoraphis robusta CCNP1315]MEA5545486.1 hypothetical protein [Limnoraphis robusta CCNP1324]